METVKIDKTKVDKLFEESLHQGDVMLELYKMVYPNWDEIEKVDGFPKCSREVADYCCQKFVDFDKVNHPKVMAGGIWLNNGFTVDDNLDGWNVTPAKVILKGLKV